MPVVLTIEGGGSLGVYEAGMTWALTQIFKQQSEADPSRRDSRLPHLRLAAVSGASAGSINALFAASAWCMQHDTLAPEQSLFWRVWTTTGITQLLPTAASGGYGDAGLFSRQYFDSVLFKNAKSKWDAAAWRDGCSVPVGVTVTRVVPEHLVLLPGVSARNQRFASTFDASVTETNGRHQLEFRLRGDQQGASMGSLAVLPAYPDGHIGRDTVFKVFEASSGYPLAFGPQILHYGDGTPATRRDTALFFDGGVFDNGPLGLGLAVYFGGRDWPFRVVQSAATADSFPVLLYVSPDNRRRWSDSLSDVDRAATTTEDGSSDTTKARGVEAVFALIAGSVPSARQYELQQSIRLVKDLSQAERRFGENEHVSPFENTYTSARWHPIVGDWMYGFAGFLGRPFREYDFYVGIYDALELLAERVMAPVRCPDAEPRSAQQKQCVAQALGELIRRPAVNLGPVAPRVLRYLYSKEFHEMPVLALGNDSARVRQQSTANADASIAVNLTIAAAMGALMQDPAQSGVAHRLRRCDDHGILAGVVCSEGLVSVTDSIRAHRDVLATLRQWREAGDSTCDKDADIRYSGECRADARFLEVVDDPILAMHAIARLLIERLLVTTPRGGLGDKAVRGIGILYFSMDQPYRRGNDLGQTTVPPRRGGAKLLYVLPSYAYATVGAAAAEIGWEARRNSYSSTALVLPVRLGFGKYSSSATSAFARHTRLVAGPAFSLKPGFVLSEVRVGENVWFGLDSLTRHSSLADRLSPELSVFLIGDKLRTAVAYAPRSMISRRGFPLLFEFGIGDLNGLTYWLSR